MFKILALICLLLVGCDILEPKEKIVYRNFYYHSTISVNVENRLQILDVSWEWENSNRKKLTVTGRAKNVGDTILEFTKIYVRAYDSNDDLISTEYNYLNETELNVGVETIWIVVDLGCPQKPNKVTVGYSYTTGVMVAPAKRAKYDGGKQ